MKKIEAPEKAWCGYCGEWINTNRDWENFWDHVTPCEVTEKV